MEKADLYVWCSNRRILLFVVIVNIRQKKPESQLNYSEIMETENYERSVCFVLEQ